MKKIIGVFFAVFVVLMPVYVWADNCPAGKYLNDGVCTLCPEGTYNDTPNATSCKSCETETNGIYKHTWTDDNPAQHDNINDCIALVKFHGNGGTTTNNNDHYVHIFDAAAHYTNSTTYTQSLWLRGSGVNAVYLGTSSTTSFSVTDGLYLSSDTFNSSEWTRSGHAFDGWYLDAELTNKLSQPNNYIFTEDIDLYAKWRECGENLVPDGDKCVCKKGYYGSEDSGCTKCGQGYTTLSNGAIEASACKRFFKYGSGTSAGVWTWPDAVDPGDFDSTNVY